MTHQMEKGIRMAKDKITHKTHGLKGYYLSGHYNIKHITNRMKRNVNGQYKQNMRHIGQKNTSQVVLIM